VPPEVLSKTGDKRVAVGAIDVASDIIETPEDVLATLTTALRFVPRERLVASTNCGMAPMNRSIAYGKLEALGAGALLA
jgi:5-methyltetrahydropteroyltriglutamate--homocysteine methyltransferase